ncbi:MAG: EamA family transporter RarD [Comamonas sp.]|nr:EamA family transporter RarD [Comamonas sp.]
MQGVLASVVASFLFGGLYYLSPFLAPLTGEQVFAWRMVMTLPLTSLLLLYHGQGRAVGAIVQRVRQRWQLGGLLLLSAALFGVQLWLFLWAPLNGHALPPSLGYFLLPLAMVLAGRVAYGEQLSRPQWVAVALATAGVLWEVGRTGQIAWTTWVVTIGYTAYFMLRRRLATDNLAGHWLDVLLLMPMCLYWIALAGSSYASGWQVFTATPKLYALVPLLGLMSAIALALYMTAHKLLPLGLFGMLSYVEPMLLVLAALLLGERVQDGQAPMYTLIALAVAVMALEGVWQMRKTKPQPSAPAAS